MCILGSVSGESASPRQFNLSLYLQTNTRHSVSLSPKPYTMAPKLPCSSYPNCTLNVKLAFAFGDTCVIDICGLDTTITLNNNIHYDLPKTEILFQNAPISLQFVLGFRRTRWVFHGLFPWALNMSLACKT